MQSKTIVMVGLMTVFMVFDAGFASTEQTAQTRPGMASYGNFHGEYEEIFAAYANFILMPKPGLINEVPEFHELFYKSYGELLEVIKKAKVDELRSRDSRGRNILHKIMLRTDLSSGDCASLVRALLDRGANFNLPDEDGMTPLHIAVAVSNIPMVEALLNLRSGYLPMVDPNILSRPESASGAPCVTPFQLAFYSKNSYMIELFKETRKTDKSPGLTRFCRWLKALVEPFILENKPI